MLRRQPVCETEIVPSLHSNRGVESAACGGIEAAAACCGAGACATVFGDKAQPAHESSRIDKAKPIRIRVASGKRLQQPIGSRANRQLHAFTLQRCRMIRTSRALAFHGSLMGHAVLQMETKASRNAGAAAAFAFVQRIATLEDREPSGASTAISTD
jgi:hypothetical protein